MTRPEGVVNRVDSNRFVTHIHSMAEFTRHKKLQHAETDTSNIKLETVKSPPTKKSESSASEKVTKARSKPITKKEKQFFDCSQCPAVFSTKSELKVRRRYKIASATPFTNRSNSLNLFSNTRRSIRPKCLPAKYAVWPPRLALVLADTDNCTQMANHSNVLSATRPSKRRIRWRDICGYM